MRHRHGTTVIYVLLVVVAMCPLAAGLPCNCNNGQIIESKPRCQCSCESGFVLPNCDYMRTDLVRVDLYLNLSASQFASDAFLTGLARGVTVDKSNINFLEAVRLDKFGKTEVLLIMPGDGVERLIPQVWNQVQWVKELRLESAYVIPIPPAPSSRTTKFVLFEVQGFSITLDGTIYLIFALIIIFILVVIENFCWYKNTDEVIAKYGYKKQLDAAGWTNAGGGRRANLDGKTLDEPHRENSPNNRAISPA